VRSSRRLIDAAAAVVILQSALDRERATGEPAGDLVDVP
jgi:putative holliday junction resolvase